MVTLTEIVKGDVTFKNNPKLAFIDTIQWDDIEHENNTIVSIEISVSGELNGLLVTCFIENSFLENCFC